MTSKEAYEILLEVWLGDKTEEEGFPDYDDINEALDTLKQDLERLEMLEKENQELKNILDADIKALIEGCRLAEENEKLKKEIKQLKDNEALVEMYLNTSDETVKSQQKVWQLKNAIKNILEYAKCELDNIEIVDRIENILMEVGYYE